MTSCRKSHSENTLYSVLGYQHIIDDLTPTVMKSKVNWTMLFTSIAILAFVCLHACLMIGINPKARKYAKAKPCSDAAQEKPANIAAIPMS